MSFLSSLWSGIKGAATNIYSDIKSVGNSVLGTIKSGIGSITGNSNLANAGAAQVQGANISNTPYQPNLTQSNAPVSNLGAVQNVASQNITNQLSNAVNSGGSYMQNGQVVNSSNYTPKTYSNTNTSIFSNSGVRPSTASTRTDQYGRVSNQDVGSQYVVYNADGSFNKVVVPKVNFSGVSGSGESLGSLAPQGATGTSGIGGSSFTGLLGGTSGLSTPAMAGSTDEDKKKNQSTLSLGGVAKGIASQIGASPFVTGALNTFSNLFSQSPAQLPQIQQPNTSLQPTMPVDGTLNAGTLAEKAKANSAVLSTPQNNLSSDIGLTNSSINESFTTAKTKLDQQVPTPINPVVDTSAQLDFINNSPDPFGIKQAMDEFKAQNTQLGELQSSRIETIKNIQALNDAYSGVIDEIKSNPNLPKGLATRRLQEINTQQKTTLQGFLNQMELINQSIADQNESVNRAFQIVENAQSQQEKSQDNARQYLQLMVQSGAIGGFTEADINTYSQATGVSPSALKSLKDAANAPEYTTTSVNDTLVITDKKTGKVISQTPVGTQSGAGAGNTQYAQSLYQQLKTRSLEYSQLTADDKKVANSIFAQMGETIPRALTAAEKNAQQSAVSGINAVDQIRTMFDQGTLPLGRSFLLGDSVLGRISGNDQFETLKKEAADVITRIRTGAALNESEVRFYQGLLPKFGNSDADIKLKLDQLTGFYLGMSGLPVTVVAPDKSGGVMFDDLYDSKQRLELRKAISAGYVLQY